MLNNIFKHQTARKIIGSVREMREAYYNIIDDMIVIFYVKSITQILGNFDKAEL